MPVAAGEVFAGVLLSVPRLGRLSSCSPGCFFSPVPFLARLPLLGFRLFASLFASILAGLLAALLRLVGGRGLTAQRFIGRGLSLRPALRLAALLILGDLLILRA